MISFDEAVELVRRAARPLGAERVGLDSAARRVLAAPVSARIASPRSDVSAMDGYAIRDADLTAFPASLKVVGESFKPEVDHRERRVQQFVDPHASPVKAVPVHLPDRSDSAKSRRLLSIVRVAATKIAAGHRDPFEKSAGKIGPRRISGLCHVNRGRAIPPTRLENRCENQAGPIPASSSCESLAALPVPMYLSLTCRL